MALLPKCSGSFGKEMGPHYQRGRIWWIKFYYRDQPIRESSNSSDREDADRLLKRRMGEIATRRFSGVAPERVRIGDLFADVKRDYTLHGRRSSPQPKSRLQQLQTFADVRAADLMSHHIERYVLRRQDEEASNASINRELQVLKRALALALECGPPKIARAPYIRLLPENNVRRGFLDDGPCLKLRTELPDYLKPLFVVAYHLGNRLGELRDYAGIKWTLSENVFGSIG